MSAWLLLIMSDNKSAPASPWTSDLSGLPLTNRRAYGRIITTPFQFRDATIKRLKQGLYALTLTSTSGVSAIVYFTRDSGQPLERFEIRHRPSDILKKGSLPTGITSVQFIAPDPKTDEMSSHIYKERFSTRLNFGGMRDGRATGSLVIVFPDSKRSFVSGAFKARFVGFSQP